MSLLYSPSIKYPEGDFRKNQEIFVDSSPHYHQQQQQSNQQQHNSGLMQYRSAPSSFYENLINGSSGGDCTEDDPYFRSSSPEIDTFLAKYTLPCNNNGSGDSGSQNLQEFEEKSTKQEDVETTGYSNGSSQLMYQSLQVQGLENDGVASSMALENSIQAKMATGNGSNLIRQSSSPAGFYYSQFYDAASFGGGNGGTNGGAGPSTSRLHNHINFSKIAEIRSQKGYMSNFHSDSWDDDDDDQNSFNGLKRAREDDGDMFFDHQNGNSGIIRSSTGLTHHLSLPKTSSEMATTVEKFLHFQGGSVPCKIRAKRGFATHPRSIAERVRRTKISERMRKLQDLFPNMDKQANTADMLDMAVEYIKDLQKQVKTLTDTKAKCVC